MRVIPIRSSRDTHPRPPANPVAVWTGYLPLKYSTMAAAIHLLLKWPLISRTNRSQVARVFRSFLAENVYMCNDYRDGSRILSAGCVTEESGDHMPAKAAPFTDKYLMCNEWEAVLFIEFGEGYGQGPKPLANTWFLVSCSKLSMFRSGLCNA